MATPAWRLSRGSQSSGLGFATIVALDSSPIVGVRHNPEPSKKRLSIDARLSWTNSDSGPPLRIL